MGAGSQVVETAPFAGVSGTRSFEARDGAGAPIPGRRVAVIARVHGNEPVGDPVLERLGASAAHHLIAGSVLLVRANELAASLDQRHTATGSDMNRMWDAATLDRLAAADPESLSYEERRTRELAPLLLACDAVLDLHSTSRPAAPFLVMRDDQAHALLARELGVKRLITGLHENTILSGGVAANVGLAAAEDGPRIGFTFEAGQHTDPDNANRAWEVTVRFLAGLGVWGPRPEPTAVRAEVYDIIARFKQAPAGTEPYRFVGYAGGEAGAGRRGLPERKLHSFDEIQADEVILRRGRSVVVRSHHAFTMLMPAPATPPDTDLYYVAQPRQGGLTNGEARSDEQARVEATAIERMLDLLSDDEFERGTTWAAFDNQRLFDLCATVVGQTLRLPPSHPHRRIVVMGRGESAASDEAERRAGHRWREAMRTAIADGMPVERIQLLRGAQLAWIDALTRQSMRELVGQRHDRGGPRVRMRVSLRQPHTASLLVAGDLDLALRTGDTRHVRVVLLIEAATVEPAGGTARVRVVRSGVVSTRPEVLAAAASLLRSLREEHRVLVHHGQLHDDPGVAPLLLPDDAIGSVAEAEPMAALRASLVRVQLRLWCEQLRLELRAPVSLPSEADVGRWLAATMASTGILDADALAQLVIRPRGSGFVADPAALESTHADLDRGPSAVPVAPPPAKSARQPLFAADVTADDLERWVSWTRFVRACRVVPDTRGKDLDLALSGGAIRDTLSRWFDEARTRAEGRPGDVLVVVAGDGLNPTRDRMSDAFPLYRSHRALLLDGDVHLLRIQHAQGTHLAWMKDFLDAAGRRRVG
ncbi:MAG: succinylglutamate desuccinylase/aspartoacylase family protein, partial [Myxococcota bacterium]